MPVTTTTTTGCPIDAGENLRLAKDYMKKSTWLGLGPDDVLSACYFGLVRAALEYDPSKGRFSTFAYWKMRGEVCRDSEILAFPFTIRRETIRRMKTSPDSPASRDARMALDAACGCASVVRDRSVAFDDDRDPGLASGVAAIRKYQVTDHRSGADPVAAVIEREEAGRRPDLAAMVERLPDRERAVLVARLGLDGSEPATLEALAAGMGISWQGVQQVYNRAIHRLRINMGVAS